MNPPTALDASSSPLPNWRLLGQRQLLHREWLVWLALFALWFGATLWLRPLALPDEGRYVGVAWAMLQSGDWSVPMLNGAPFFHKPPLFYWLTAASIQLFGPSAAAARFASWLAATAVATGLFAFVRCWVGTAAARASVLVLATLPLFYAGAQYANLDMLVAGCIAGAVLLVAHAVLAGERGAISRGALASAFGVAALGVLAKGLIGVVLPVLVLLAWGASSARLRRVCMALGWLPGWLIFLAIAAPWFVVMQWHFPGFAHYFFVVQHFERYAASGFNNVQPFWFYPIVLIALGLPWSTWLLGALWRDRATLVGPRGPDADVLRLMLAWLGVVIVFFSLPSSKPIGYILPAGVPLGYLSARAVRSFAGFAGPGHARWRRAVASTAALAAALCVGAAILAHFYQPKSLRTLAMQLQSARLPGEPVFFLGNYYYDVAFYARLDAPVQVVDAWRPEEIAKDSWRRELVDAERFRAASPTHLLRPDALAPTLCESPSTWVIGPWPGSSIGNGPAPQPAYRSGTTALWHVVATEPGWRDRLGCGLAAAPGRGITPTP